MKYLLLFLVLCLSACGVIQDRSTDYLQASSSPIITFPEGLSDENVQVLYPVPDISNKRSLSKKYELPRPPNVTAAFEQAPYLVEELDGQVWLRVYTSPGRVWPMLDAFWRDKGITIAQENIANGYVVTQPLVDSSRLQQALGEKNMATFSLDDLYFQAQLTQGIRRNTSEIKLRVMDSQSENASIDDWHIDAENIERGKAILTVLGEFISSDAMQNRHSLLANTIGGDSRVQLLQSEAGESYLLINLSFQRAWNELEKAMKAADILVSDKDLSAKKYFISYLNASEIKGWYLSESAIFEKRNERNFSLTLEELPQGGIKVEVEQLNEALAPAVKKDLLDLVYEHIS